MSDKWLIEHLRECGIGIAQFPPTETVDKLIMERRVAASRRDFTGQPQNYSAAEPEDGEVSNG